MPAPTEAQRRILEQPQADAGDWNDAAWSLLFLEEAPTEALEWARRAVDRSGGKYRRAPRPPDPWQLSSWELARRRLRAMELAAD